MPIIDEITRLQQAKQDFKTKLIEKNVAVGDELLISDYPPLLDEIKTGVSEEEVYSTLLNTRFGSGV
jgi:hypothetical protein